MVVQPLIRTRSADPAVTRQLIAAGVHPLIARLWAARGEHQPATQAWNALVPPSRLTQAATAAQQLADALAAGRKLLVIADYDCDGATACAVAVQGLRDMGGQVDFLVPDRFSMGYGLSTALVNHALERPCGRPDLIITVDNGIASVDGVALARAAGVDVIITDHHLPGAVLPDANAIVNPNQPGCAFPSKALAGVGVLFYVLLAVRATLRQRGIFPPQGGPRLDHYADLVALGTVADVVRLDSNNRLLVAQGLKRIRQGRACAGINALFEIAGKDPRCATARDLGFAIGPRINAAGRMADMGVGIQCLLARDPGRARHFAQKLDDMNRDRQTREATMGQQALDDLQASPSEQAASVCVWRPDWHPGVIGLVASRLKETYWRPALAFAPDEAGLLRGSGRSIPDVHLRDALDLVSRTLPDAIVQFGGHAMAAGLTLHTRAFDAFASAFDAAVRQLSGKTTFIPQLETDGSLEREFLSVDVAAQLEREVWGAGFPPPSFTDCFRVVHQRVLKNRHLKLFLERDGLRLDAIWFGHAEPLPETVRLVYALDVNRWRGQPSAQLRVQHASPA